MVTEAGRKRAVAALLAAALLLSGVAVGVAVDRLLLGGGRRASWWVRQQPPAQLEKLRRALELDEAQARAVEEILTRRWGAMAEIFRRMDPELEAIRGRASSEIRAVLTSEQRRRYEDMLAEQERRRAALRERLELPGGAPRAGE